LSKVTLIAIDNAGTVELAVCNGSLSLDESTLISTTALSADADSATVVYSTIARTNVPFRVVGFVESTQATAGTWASAPSKIQGAGGLVNPTVADRASTITSATAVTASGTSVDFTGIPAWVKRITVMISGVSTNGTSNWLLQLGDSGGIENTGYLCSSSQFGTGVSTSEFTSGFGLTYGSAAAVAAGTIQFSNLDGNVWVANGVMVNIDSAVTRILAGTKTLSDTLTQVRITTVGGVNNFDAGTINILYEG